MRALPEIETSPHARLSPLMPILALAGALSCAACAGESPPVGGAEEELTEAHAGLWRLEGAPQEGDMALLHLSPARYASLLHRSEPASEALEAANAGTRAAPAAPVEPPTARGVVERRGRAAALRPTDSAEELEITAAGVVLEVKRPDGSVLRYRRDLQLYCVAADRGVEATAILELGKQPSVVGVNGDGVTFPSEGTYPASVDATKLFDEDAYVIAGKAGTKRMTISFAWADMNRSAIDGTMTIAGTSTPISCEPFTAPPPP